MSAIHCVFEMQLFVLQTDVRNRFIAPVNFLLILFFRHHSPSSGSDFSLLDVMFWVEVEICILSSLFCLSALSHSSVWYSTVNCRLTAFPNIIIL